MPGDITVKSEVCDESNVTDVDNDNNPTDNPYAYLERNDFTSEKYKIEIRGLPKFYGISELKKLLNEKLKLGSNKIKPPKKGSSWIYVCFRSEKDREDALQALNGYTWKNKLLTADIAKAAPDPLVKRRNENRLGNNDAKKQKLDPSMTQEEILKANATPLWNVPYSEQLVQKQETVKALLKRFANELGSANRSLKPWLEEQASKYDGLPCQLLDIIGLPEKCNGYRNKCEFTIGKNQETGERTIGFRLGSYALGTIGVGPIQGLDNIPDRMKQAVQVFEKFIRDSDLDVFNPETHSGSWRQLTARHATVTDQLMLVVGVHPQQMTEEELEKVKESLRQYFSNGEGKDINITSLYFQIIRKKQSGEELPKPEHLFGEKYIVEELCGLKFRISPEAFFQVNSAVAELLYDSVRKLAELNEKSTLIDVCCGTGSIGLCLARGCGQVLGLELQEEAVNDAKQNAVENNINNCTFFSGKAEEILSSVISRASNDNVVAVVDPPRAGLHQKAVILLRRTSRLNKMVYLACDAKLALKNFVDLGRPASKTLSGDPFVPIAAVAVDMFPHTNHCELVLCLQRIDPSTITKKNKTNTTAV
ncbi:tRNA (uracil-5-)-methyltransferase homolog A [Lycorma delicatula]|uniref:tRNA (uracil-5-)-methyltransferase homolog A n=1 Tax=Lycorma delicatula TaxID=130591 RepID=UPI003F5166BC